MNSAITDAARAYIRRGWTPIALGPDADGRPKRPLYRGWQNLHPNDERTRKQGWKDAIGIGILCGPHSGNLAVIDIDDEDLAAAVFAKLVLGHKPFRWVWTGRRRGHLYVREQIPTEHGRVWSGTWEGREVRGELRCKGQQVAAPPTPGYILASDQPPQAVESVGEAWKAVCMAMGILQKEAQSNYPLPWREQVENGTRNDSLFIEACKLAAVRMPLERALQILSLNSELTYSGLLDKVEFEATVQSAYKKAYPRVAGPALSERYRREL